MDSDWYCSGVAVFVAHSLCLAPRKGTIRKAWPARVFVELTPSCIGPTAPTNTCAAASIASPQKIELKAESATPKLGAGKIHANTKQENEPAATPAGSSPISRGATTKEAWVKFFGIEEEEAFECVPIQAMQLVQVVVCMEAALMEGMATALWKHRFKRLYCLAVFIPE